MRNVVRDRKIRLGVLGAFRGEAFAAVAEHAGMRLVAICDSFEPRQKKVSEKYGVKGYSNFDDFLRHDMDAVVVASSFHQHAGYAIRAMERGLHVLSETSSNVTLAEGALLYEKAEETGLCYMLAENYCYTKFIQEMKKLYNSGEIGAVRYAEGEYNHPMSMEETLRYSPGVNHWRNNLPYCYYITHALAPMMYVTDTRPVEVSCSIIPASPGSFYKTAQDNNHGAGECESAFIIVLRMDSGAVFRIIGGGLAGHSCWYGFHGTTGAMETSRGHGYFGPETVRVWHEPWDLGGGRSPERVYVPRWPSHEAEANSTGHGGGDFFVALAFADAIKSGTPPYLDAYRGVTMSNVGILAWRSAHANGAFVRVPDLKNKTDCDAMLADRLCPFAGVENSVLMPPEMLAKRTFTPEWTAAAKKIWKEIGYNDAEIEEMLVP